MGGIARIRRPYMARRLWVDAAVRLQQKFAPSQLHNSQYGAWFVWTRSKIIGAGASLPRIAHNLGSVIYSCTRTSSPLPFCGQRSGGRRGWIQGFAANSLAEPILASQPARFLGRWTSIRTGASPALLHSTTHHPVRLLNCRNLSCAFQLILVAILHALGALTAAVGIELVR
ncbi:hypothetical protein B0H15DRAFT_277345 [Mycena belliarum]|uniref:Uncharacterized protein n=1 Tax=Mycena belliarum TaxID=1033014 RepID=A0AAD6TQ92_9AGAR|nr:hypothetical protein B0H15DRAFT_277345 [Mycena belliae]